MKSGIRTLFESAINDNQEYIFEFEGSIYDYFMYDLENADNGIFFYLSDEEIELYEKGDNAEREKLEEEVKDFLGDYKITIEEFLNK